MSLVPYAAAGSADMALALSGVHRKTAEELEAEQEQRHLEAEVLEVKLKRINETVPTKIYNTCSSSAGAGSSDFHMYRMIRKSEQERQKRLDIQDKHESEMKEFEATRRERELLAEQRTSRKRAKRQKKKAKKAKTGPDAGGKAGEGAKESSSSEDEDALPAAALD